MPEIKIRSWHEIRMSPDHVKRALALGYIVDKRLGEKRGDWVKLVAEVYQGLVLPEAVASSMERLERLAKPWG